MILFLPIGILLATSYFVSRLLMKPLYDRMKIASPNHSFKGNRLVDWFALFFLIQAPLSWVTTAGMQQQLKIGLACASFLFAFVIWRAAIRSANVLRIRNGTKRLVLALVVFPMGVFSGLLAWAAFMVCLNPIVDRFAIVPLVWCGFGIYGAVLFYLSDWVSIAVEEIETARGTDDSEKKVDL